MLCSSNLTVNKNGSTASVEVNNSISYVGWGEGSVRGGRKLLHTALIAYTRVGTLIVATIYLQLTQNRYMFRSFSVLHCSHQHCVQPVASDVEIVGYL